MMLTTLANPFVCGLQRIKDIVLTPDSCVLFVHQFESEKQLTILSGYPTSYLTPWSILQQTAVSVMRHFGHGQFLFSFSFIF